MHRYLLMDVFTDRRLEGNALAVVLDADDLDGGTMQRIARELNLSETVFVLAPDSRGADARIRIFTPGAELPFAGHPVLGTAVALGDTRGLATVRLACAAGTVPVTLTPNGDRVTAGRMSQPVPTWAPYEHADEVLAALGVDRSELPVEAYTNGPRHVYVTLAEPARVAAVVPDLTALGRLPGVGVNVTAGAGTAWKTRNFGPAVGVPEDPATGSAAGPLAVHLARHGRIPFGVDIEIAQGAEIGRPSVLIARVDGAVTAAGHRIDRVEVAGSAVTVGRGELDV